MIDTIQEIYSTFKRSKLRTSLTGCAVSVGIFLLIVLLGAGNGIIHAFEHASGNMALDVLNIYPSITSKPYKGMQEGRFIEFDSRDMKLSKAQFPDKVKEATGVLSQGNVTFRYEGDNVSGSLSGVYSQYASMENVAIAEGRFLNDADLHGRRKVGVISEHIAEELFGKGRMAVGKMITVNELCYRVVGVYVDEVFSRNTTIYIPFTTLQTVYRKGVTFEYLKLRTQGLKTKESNDLFEKNYRGAMGRFHRFDPEDRGAMYMYNTNMGAEQTAKALDILRTSLWIIGLLTMLSGIVGVSNIMLITVKERTHEFGIRKALGARPWSILRVVMLESVLITSFFGYVGLVLGVLATEYLNYWAGNQVVTIANNDFTVFLNPTVDIHIAFQAVLTLVVAGMLAGFIPARKAVNVKPIEALRAE